MLLVQNKDLILKATFVSNALYIFYFIVFLLPDCKTSLINAIFFFKFEMENKQYEKYSWEN